MGEGGNEPGQLTDLCQLVSPTSPRHSSLRNPTLPGSNFSSTFTCSWMTKASDSSGYPMLWLKGKAHHQPRPSFLHYALSPKTRLVTGADSSQAQKSVILTGEV